MMILKILSIMIKTTPSERAHYLICVAFIPLLTENGCEPMVRLRVERVTIFRILSHSVVMIL